MAQLSLENILFNSAAQDEIIHRFLLPDLRQLAETEQLDWLGNPMQGHTSRGRRGPVPLTLPALISVPEPEVSTKPDFSALVAQIEALLQAFPTDGSLRTWIILLSLYTTDMLIDKVVRQTEQQLADAYFGGLSPTFRRFEDRMTAYLSGQSELTNNADAPSSSKSKVMYTCTSPVLAVAEERLVFHELQRMFAARR